MKRSTIGFLVLASLTGPVAAEPGGVYTPQLQYNSPANDDLANAETLVESLYLVPGDLSYSSRELKEPRITPASLGRTVWYKYTATATGRAVIFVTKRYYEAPFQIGVYSGTSYADLKRLGVAQIAGTTSDYSGAVGFDAVKGSTYYVQIDTATRASGFIGSFLIGAAAVGTTGRIAAFAAQPLVFHEYYNFDYNRVVYAANGHTGTINITYSLQGMNNNVSVSSTSTTLAPGKTTIFKFNDEYGRFADGTVHAGALDLISKATSNSALLGEKLVPMRTVTPEYTNKPYVEVRFVDAKPGVRSAGTATSRAYVRNTGATTALGCHFDTNTSSYNAVVATHYTEVLADGTTGSADGIFTLKPGQSRTFDVSTRVISENYNNDVFIRCADYYGSFSNTESSTLEPTPYYGPYANVLVRPKADNVFGEVKLADFGSKRVLVDVVNSGLYSGYVSLSADDDTYEDRAVLTSMCLANASGACVGPTSTSSISFDMAQGETRKVALSVRRGSSTTPGEIKLWAHATDYSTYDVVGYGAVTLKK